MFCGHCGKRVLNDMLFCPFCGSPIVIPDQEDVLQIPAPTEAVPTENVPAEDKSVGDQTAGESSAAEKTPIGLFMDFDEAEEKQEKPAAPKAEEKITSKIDVYNPIIFSFEDEKSPKEAPEPAETDKKRRVNAAEDILEEAPARRRMRPETATARTYGQGRRSTNTYIPVKDMDYEDMFMDDPDDFDDYDDPDDDFFTGKTYIYDDEDEGSFFARHMRGIVALILMLAVLAVLAVWGCSDGGQKMLAKFNLAWRASVYAELGDSSYVQGTKEQAAEYYEKAFARDTSNYEYAHSAMVAYYESGEVEKAAAMLKKCIAMNGDDAEPYLEMLVLYPDAQTRPWEITEIVRDGYARTGDARLNVE